VPAIVVELWCAALSGNWNGDPKMVVGASNCYNEAMEIAAVAARKYCLISASWIRYSVASRCGSGLVEV